MPIDNSPRTEEFRDKIEEYFNLTASVSDQERERRFVLMAVELDLPIDTRTVIEEMNKRFGLFVPLAHNVTKEELIKILSHPDTVKILADPDGPD